jgi:hypothetical protein
MEWKEFTEDANDSCTWNKVEAEFYAFGFDDCGEGIPDLTIVSVMWDKLKQKNK